MAHAPPSRARDDSRTHDGRPVNGTYRVTVPAPSPAVRRDAFARFVRRAVDRAKDTRNWTVKQIVDASVDETGKPRVGRSTIYRWMNGDWERAPLPEQIEGFCDALDIPPQAALVILWPGKGTRPVRPTPELDPDVELLLRRLEDPNVPAAEKYHIRETIKGLANRSIRRAGGE